jgi:undecaprenyl-diphosphatase
VAVGVLYLVDDIAPEIDHAILNFLKTFRTPELDVLVIGLSQLGRFKILFPATIVLALVVSRVSKRLAIFAVISMAFSAACVQLIKLLMERPRPGDGWAMYDAGGFSFPSGHSAAGLTMALTINILLIRLFPELRKSSGGIFMLTVIVLVGILIGISRSYLGVHFPTDVVAGWALAFGTVAVAGRILLEPAR